MSPALVRWAFLMGLTLSLGHASFPLQAQDKPDRKGKTPAESAAQKRVFDAIEELRAASAEWRKELGPKAKIDDETFHRLRESTLGMMKELGTIIDQTEKLQREVKANYAQRLSARDQAKPLIDAMRAIGPDAAEKRDATVKHLRDSLAGTNSEDQMAALIAIASVGDVNYDKASFRPLLLSIIEKGQKDVLMAALLALYNTERQPEDLALVQGAWNKRSQEVDEQLAYLLFLFGDKKIDGRSAEIVLTLLKSPIERTQTETLRGLWGATVTDDVAAQLIKMSENPALRHNAIYFGLSTLQDKSDAVLDTLIKALPDEEWRSLWGLGFGVPKKSQKKVAEALVDLHNSRTDPKVRKDCAKLVHEYGGEEFAGKLNH